MPRTPPPLPPSPSPDVLAAVVRGEPEAVDAWYRVEHPVVYRLCFGFLADREEAGDAAQDALLLLRDRLAAWDPARPYPAWRNAVVRNGCRDRLRRLEARRRAEAHAPGDERVRPLPAPEEAAHADEVRRILEDALRRLAPREREVFVLRELEELPTDEVAGILGIGAGSVRTVAALARRRLRNLLAPRLEAGGRRGS